MNIEWNLPPPRHGLLGEWDKLVGLGQTQAEFLLILIPSLLAGLGVSLYAIRTGLGWTTVQLIIAGLIAFDLTGGVVTNATASAKRWYHRPGQGWLQQLGFVAIHALHIFLIAWLFRAGDWLFFIIYYAYLLAASLVITRAPIYLQRPVALFLLVGVLLLNIYGLPAVPGLEWFVPLFFLELLVSHLTKEAPYAVD